jgi:glycosyltransferase involved in cell wall biosynthesis
MKKVSVIIPTFNRFNYLKNAVQSVLNQSHNNLEIIIINDGSTQPEYYSDIKTISSDKTIIIHMGQNSSHVVGDVGRAAYTRNIGLKIASGDYIAFLDDDDIWLPNKLETQLKHMEKTKCEMSCTEAYLGSGIFHIEKKYEKYITEHYNQFYKSIGIFNIPDIWNKKFLEKHNSCICSSVLISKNVIQKIGMMPYIKVGEDYAYWLKALNHTNCAFINTPLCYYDNNHGDGALYI